MSNRQTVWTKECSADEMIDVAEAVLKQLTSHQEQPFLLALSGPLGAGKTTLVGAMLRCIGLPSDQPVTSPTYTYVQEYELNGNWYAHLDLYRCHGAGFFDGLGLEEIRDFAGFFIEWAEKDPDLLPHLTHEMVIEFAGEDRRRYQFFTRSPTK